MKTQAPVYFVNLFAYPFLASWQVDSSDNIVVTGETTSTSLDGQAYVGNYDVFVMKFTSAGVHTWTVVRGSSSQDGAKDLEAESGRCAESSAGGSKRVIAEAD